jgi:hypothetical protein
VTPATPGSGSAGSFKSNEDPTHETGESATREQAENSGQFPGPGGHSNEASTHESSESSAREAQENAGATQTPAAPSQSTTTPAQ